MSVKRDIISDPDSALKASNLMRKSIHTTEQEQLQALLRELRTAAGMRQADLAAKLGVPQSFVSKFEAGERRLDFLELRTVCHALGMQIVDFAQQFEKRLNETE
jgi:ribosome-binding protein aMBF1 (putative translation factor)